MNAIACDARCAADRGVWVDAPARLHMGFVDLNGQLGRRFGSVGMTLEGVGILLRATPSRTLMVNGPGADRAAQCVHRLAHAWGVPAAVRVDIDRDIPAHVGLGSGTQMSLAVGAALAGLYGLDAHPRDIAQVTHRGARSGIGIGAFESGGFLLDGGRGVHADAPPPVIARLDVPANWRIVLVLERGGRGIHGQHETAAFGALAPFPAGLAARLSRLVLMQMLPALAEADLPTFGAALEDMQQRIGDYFAPVQGARFTSARVAAAVQWLRERGAVGPGQSSWGPTGFCLVDGEQRAQSLAAEARRHFSTTDSLSFLTLEARNAGSRVWGRQSTPTRQAGFSA